ncbi:MAG: sigma 54-interacting transcriptional regulator [Candidatus Accumulibacter sp.]|jgi:PAS domain S-box-containing protein|nr:sigma 54-interacting transcriptional regulator [Accumulibacter sp.]
MKEIVVVAPIPSMLELTRQVIDAEGHGAVEVRPGNIRGGLEAARQAIGEGAKVIVSRGGTYQMIKADTDLPVVEIKVTAFDLIESFREAKRAAPANGLIGVIGYSNVISGADIVAELMGLKAMLFEIVDLDDIAAEVDRQIGLGIRVFVGDGNVECAASRYESTVILVQSGTQAIRDAIQEAERILHAARNEKEKGEREKEKAQQFSAIIDFVQDGIIATDDRGVVTVFNSASEKIVGRPREEALGQYITNVFPEIPLLDILKTKRSEIGEIRQLKNGTVISSNLVPVAVDGAVKGVVATYQDITEVQRLERGIRIRLSENGFVAQHEFDDIVHRSEAMEECIRTARKFSDNLASVLISGPTGVGKELFAQSIHNGSRRRNFPFVAINCAALPETLIESELFGYVDGSFTGAAKKGKAGLFEMAHGGTVFLDEISELPTILQGRLLRVLQEKKVMRIGDNKLIPVDVRVICASNRDLRKMAARKQFRADLYFRIAILSLYVPALAERREDVEILSWHFVHEAASRYRKGKMTLAPEALTFLRGYPFEGNVRELQGMIERAVVVCEGRIIQVADLIAAPNRYDGGRDDDEPGIFFSHGQTLKEMEDRYIEHVFQKTNGSISAASVILGVDRTTLWRRMKGRGRGTKSGDAQEWRE